MNSDEASAWILRFHRKGTEGVEELTDLDRRAGDGDFGWNISSALTRATHALQSDPGMTPGQAFGRVCDAFLNTGGTSGPLFGLWFGELARSEAELWSLRELRTAVRAGTAAVMRLGKAELGHMTMVDAMVPAAIALEQANLTTPVWAAVADAAAAAMAGAESTQTMVARRGRASYIGERARGVIDPGALAVAWFFASGSSAS